MNPTRVLGDHDAWQGHELQTYLEALIADSELRVLVTETLNRAGAKVSSLHELAWFLGQCLPALAKGNQARAASEALCALKTMDARVKETHRVMNNPPSRVYWPNPKRDFTQQLAGLELVSDKATPFITRQTRVASAGSCFAAEIALALQHYGFNYIVEETFADAASGVVHAPFYDGLPYARSSAAWGIIFNTPSFRQLIERAFGLREDPKLLLGPYQNMFAAPYFTPFRESVYFRSVEAFEEDYDPHLAAARRVFEQCDVFIMTLGMTECWAYAPTDSVISRGAMNSGLMPLLERRCLSYEENISNLQSFRDILHRYNPSAQIILSVSPVPLIATLRSDESHVVVSNQYSKSVLRVAAEEMVRRNENVHYLPSYEAVTWCTPQPYKEDLRHVSDEAVDAVMALFNQTFVVDGAFNQYCKSEMLAAARSVA